MKSFNEKPRQTPFSKKINSYKKKQWRPPSKKKKERKTPFWCQINRKEL
jgi:hypothetical protein